MNSMRFPRVPESDPRGARTLMWFDVVVNRHDQLISSCIVHVSASCVRRGAGCGRRGRPARPLRAAARGSGAPCTPRSAAATASGIGARRLAVAQEVVERHRHDRLAACAASRRQFSASRSSSTSAMTFAVIGLTSCMSTIAAVLLEDHRRSPSCAAGPGRAPSSRACRSTRCTSVTPSFLSRTRPAPTSAPYGGRNSPIGRFASRRERLDRRVDLARRAVVAGACFRFGVA